MSEAEVQPSTETVEPAGLDAIISGAMEKHGYGDEAATETPDTKADDKPAEIKIDADGRARAADGKFASTKPAEVEPSITEPAKTEAKPAETVAVEPPKAEPIQPPARWSEADKAEFAKLPPEGQSLFLARYNAIEGDYTRKTQELAETRKSVEPLIQEVGKWSPYLRQIGLTPDKAFTDMLTTEYTLRTGTPEQKQQSLAYLAQYYGVPLPTAGGGDPSQPDPALTQLHQTVSGLQQQLRQMNEQRVVQERERAQAEFDALGQAKDTNGQAKFPHFERVKQTMIQLVASGQADTWDTAYRSQFVSMTNCTSKPWKPNAIALRPMRRSSA
jgi:hypothetical protein